MRYQNQHKLEDNTLLVFTEDVEFNNELACFFANQPYRIEFYDKTSDFLKNILRRLILVSIIDIGCPRKLNLDFVDIVARVKPEMSLITISETHSEKTITSRVWKYYCDSLQKPVDYDKLFVSVDIAFRCHLFSPDFSRFRENEIALKERG